MRTQTCARFVVPLETKAFSQEGTFEGYASLFHRPDLGNDIILPGAFTETLKRRTASGVKMLWQHDPAAPIGIWERIVEDARGLAVRGRLLPGVTRARDVAALLAAGAVDGLSIGFKLIEARREARSGLRRIAKVDLWEISIVTFPMLPEARVATLRGSPPLTDDHARTRHAIRAAASALRR